MDRGRRAPQRLDGRSRRDRRERLEPFRGAGRAALPRPHDPLFALPALAPFDAQTIAQRIAELGLEGRGARRPEAELEALAHGYLDDAGAVSVLRWHALSGYSLELTQETGGVYTFGAGTKGLIDAIAAQAPFAQWLSTPVDSIGRVQRRRRGAHPHRRCAARPHLRARRAAQRAAADPLR